MAGIISESYESRPFSIGDQPGRELVFDVIGTDDEAEVLTLLQGAAPAAYLGLARETLDAEPLGNGIWKAHARYTRLDSDDEFTFDTGGGSQKLTQALSTIASYAPPGFTAPDVGGAIGISGDRVEGVEVPVPTFRFTLTKRFASGFVDETYILGLFNLTGCFNNATFRGFASGECKFEGASGSQRGNEDWKITFNFACSPNVTGRTVGDITGIDKLGWDYLWTLYADYEDATAFRLVNRPVAAYVVRVLSPGDFGDLGL